MPNQVKIYKVVCRGLTKGHYYTRDAAKDCQSWLQSAMDAGPYTFNPKVTIEEIYETEEDADYLVNG